MQSVTDLVLGNVAPITVFIAGGEESACGRLTVSQCSAGITEKVWDRVRAVDVDVGAAAPESEAVLICRAGRAKGLIVDAPTSGRLVEPAEAAIRVDSEERVDVELDDENERGGGKGITTPG